MGSRGPAQDVGQHQSRAFPTSRPRRTVKLTLVRSSQATKAFLAILNIHPHDPGVLRELVPLLTASKLYARAAALYLHAFDHFQTICPHVDDSTIDLISTFGTIDLETIADILNHQEQFVKTVSVIRTGVRWLQGREKETGWDALHDDREYDVVRKTRTGWERDARYLEEAAVYELDVRLRLRLGVARMGEGKVEEAQVSLARSTPLFSAAHLCDSRSVTSPSCYRRTSPSSPSCSAPWATRTTTARCTTMLSTSSRSWPRTRR